MKKLAIVTASALLSACAGGLNCTWDTQDEKFEKLLDMQLEKLLERENATKENDETKQ